MFNIKRTDGIRNDKILDKCNRRNLADLLIERQVTGREKKIHQLKSTHSTLPTEEKIAEENQDIHIAPLVLKRPKSTYPPIVKRPKSILFLISLIISMS